MWIRPFVFPHYTFSFPAHFFFAFLFANLTIVAMKRVGVVSFCDDPIFLTYFHITTVNCCSFIYYSRCLLSLKIYIPSPPFSFPFLFVYVLPFTHYAIFSSLSKYLSLLLPKLLPLVKIFSLLSIFIASCRLLHLFALFSYFYVLPFTHYATFAFSKYLSLLFPKLLPLVKFSFRLSIFIAFYRLLLLFALFSTRATLVSS